METIKAEIANIVTVSRILFSLCLFMLLPYSIPFSVFYLLCGVSDMLDGFLARRFHTESKTGELLDSAADLCFAAAYAIIILPLLSVPVWIWIWAALIAIVKIPGIVQRSKKERRLYIAHSIANKLTGLLLFLLPLTVQLIDIRLGAAVVCMTASFAAAEELFEKEETSEEYSNGV